MPLHSFKRFDQKSSGSKTRPSFSEFFPPKYFPFCYRWLWESGWSSEMMKMLIRSVNYQVGETAAAAGLSGVAAALAAAACRRNGSSRNNEGVFTCCDELGSAWLSGKWRGGVETQRGTLINLGANAIGFPSSKSRLYQMEFAPEQP